MAKPKIPNQKTKYEALNKRLSNYVALVRQIYDALNLEAAKMAERVYYSGEKPFRFGDYPQLRDSVLKLKNRFSADMQALIYRGTSKEWKESNLIQDLLADKVLKTYGAKVNGEKYKIYYQTNSDALKAFQERKDNGMSLSQKIWNQATNYREELEYAISSAIQKGTSAVTLSKRISKYLQDFDLLQKDYKQKYGKAVSCHDCEYRSIRLARSEINMAYRTAEQKRWEQMDFVVGYEIKLSHAHHHRMPHGDICDELAGKYPKDFKWTGWHPNDMCYVVPILKTEEEFWSDEDVISKNEVTDTPKQFKDWVSDNIQRAKSWKKEPYFIRDNGKYVLEDFKVDIYNDKEKSFVRKGRTKLAMSRIDYLKSIYHNLPEVELAAVNAYTQAVSVGNRNSTSREINRKLRNGTYDEYVDIASELISKCIGKMKVYKGLTYRGLALSNKRLNDVYLNNLNGIIEEKGFMSSSKEKYVAERFISHDGIKKNQKKIILIIEGKNGRDISRISEFNGIFNNENQYEILFDKSSKFLVSGYVLKNDVYYINLIEQ